MPTRVAAAINKCAAPRRVHHNYDGNFLFREKRLLRCLLTFAKFSERTKQMGRAQTNGANRTNEHLLCSCLFAVFGAFPDVRHKLFSRQIDQFGRQNVSANITVNLAADRNHG